MCMALHPAHQKREDAVIDDSYPHINHEVQGGGAGSSCKV